MKEEALKLADLLDISGKESIEREASAMIRRLVEELDKQWYMVNKDGYVKPLSDEEIWNWFEKNTALTKESALMIVRAIEERHGIK